MQRTVRNLRRGEEKKHFEMLNLCFKPWGSEEKWRRLYLQPSFGATKNVIIVEENKEWIGGATAWFREASLRENRKVKVYIAGDGYVHPNHRGKGVYSTFMRGLNKLARKKGASLGFGFVSVHGTPFIALPRYGFVDIFHPATKILILNPENFLQFIITQMQNVDFPKNFEGLRLKLLVSFVVPKGKHAISRTFHVKKGKLRELPSRVGDIKNIDLRVKTDINMLLKISSYFYLKKKTLFPILFIAFLRRRLAFRFSLNFLRMILRL